MISRLKLMDFRCYGSFSWQIPQQGAIILGNNARGKTSLLEAVCFLLRLQSPRTARTGPLVSHGKQSFGIRGELPGQIRRILWAPDAPDLRVNGEPRKDQRSYLADSYPVVWMGNDDLSLVHAGARLAETVPKPCRLPEGRHAASWRRRPVPGEAGFRSTLPPPNSE